ncbi:High affinity nitrate transporter 2.5 [Acorus gramineus]|uniref:High affinity nitrate transporter 2.5 n=1 Tax=Acorus gramineus TaxID=55184 RepID=A0AAV9AZV0_ACOGR|nr:High affinity nitrate transporter 2.5 [Acorus gramineus]
MISGMTGSGGAVGAVTTQLMFFTRSRYSKETAISLMGIMAVVCTLRVAFIYFPDSGGILCGPFDEEDPEDEEYYSLFK